MTSFTITLPDEIHADLAEVAKRLNQTPEETTQMALSLLMQFDSLDYALIAMQRINDGETIVPLPALADESELALEFHPLALEELQSLDEDDQIELLTELIERIVAEEEELEDTLDLVINESETEQVVMSSFEFGDVVYKISEKVVVYLIGIPELEEFDGLEMDMDEEDLDEGTDAEKH